MITLLGVVLLCAEPAQDSADEKPKPDFKIEVRIVEFKPIEGVTKQDPNSKYHLRIKPALVVKLEDVASARKRWLRGSTIGTKETGFKHYPRLLVDIELTKEAKLRLKAAVEKTSSRKVTTVLNDKHLGGWTKYIIDDPSSLVHWEKFAPRISCTNDEEKADRLIEYLTQSQEKQAS